MRKHHVLLIAALALVAACSREETKDATDKIKEGSAEVGEGIKEGAQDAADATKKAAEDSQDKPAGEH